MWHEITLIGRLTKDPEMKYTPQGKAVTTMNIAVDDGYGDNKSTIWIRATAWEKQAEACNTSLKKGSKVFVQGRLQHVDGNPRTGKKTDESVAASFEITASNVRFLDGKPQEEVAY